MKIPNKTWHDLPSRRILLVIFMGGSKLRWITDQLVEAGLAETTPVAVISQATLENQKTVLGTLASFADWVEQIPLSSPMLIIIGEVANLSFALNWLEKKSMGPGLHHHRANPSPVFSGM